MAQAISTQPHMASPGDVFALMKPRVMSLVIFTALVGMLVSPMDSHPVLMLISLLAIAAGAGASGAINQWYDRDIDAQMERTANRPLPRGLVHPDEALSLGLIISGMSVLVRNDDYTRVGVPMLPVVHGFKATKDQIFVYALIVGVVGMVPSFIGMSSYAYLALSAVLGLRFVMLSWTVWRSADDDMQSPMALFRFSILYLFLIFLGLGIDAAIAPFWTGF